MPARRSPSLCPRPWAFPGWSPASAWRVCVARRGSLNLLPQSTEMRFLRGEPKETDLRAAESLCPGSPAPPSPLWSPMELAAPPLRLGVYALDQVTCAAF